LGERIPDLGYDRIWSAQDIGAREPEQPDICQEQTILAAVVLDQAGAVRLAVIFETKAVLAVVEVRTTEEGTSFVSNRDLYLRTRQPLQDEQHPEARLHWRFRRSFGAVEQPAHHANPFSSLAASDPLAQFGAVDQTRVQRHIGNYDRLRQAQIPAEVGERPDE
jgi:hypothetical protein